mgnify:CR=1 FL=1
MNVKKNDTVIVLSGKDKGKKGKVLEAMPAAGKVVVEGVNVATCHVKPKKQGDQGGIVSRTLPRSCSSARSAARLPAMLSSSPTARRSASARSAARRFERED